MICLGCGKPSDISFCTYCLKRELDLEADELNKAVERIIFAGNRALSLPENRRGPTLTRDQIDAIKHAEGAL